ncbi:hypothetical protein ACX80H_03950 [Arthrobacter sp. MDT2-2]
MPLVIVQPAGNREGKRNYAKTVESPISLTATQQHLSAGDQEQLAILHPSGAVPVWGTTRGERGQMESRWNRITAGDVVLFTGGNRVFKTARVTHKFRSQSLADSLWERKTTANGDKASWEFMYSFNQPEDADVSYDDLKEVLGELPLPTREFSVLTSQQSDPILNYLEDHGATPPPEPTPAATQTVLKEFEAMESEYIGKRRTEQQYLRQYLLPGVEGDCLLCGRTFSRDFLVAAHIKKRSLCTPQEKADIPAVAMLACRFGCDELYERGMIVVSSQGKVAGTKRLTDDSARTYANNHAVGRTIKSWSSLAASHDYFEAHRSSWAK